MTMPPPPERPEPATSGRRTLVWVGAAVTLGVLAVVVVVVFALRGGTGPEDAVEAWDRAWEEVDCAAYMDVTTEQFRADELQVTDDEAVCDAFEAEAEDWNSSSEYQHWSFSVIGPDGERGDTADVLVRVTLADGPADDEAGVIEETWTVVVEQGDGVWRVADIEYPED